MAGDWIKVQLATKDKPEVFQISEVTGLDPDAVLGKLIRIWVWADEQTYDGHAGSVTRSLLDRVTGHAGFADAMLQAGWLVDDNGRLLFPNFERHNGETAKKRALSTKRQQRKREVSRDCHAESVTKARPEKRREEKSDKPPPPTPSLATAPVVPNAAGDGWGGVVVSLSESGVSLADQCVDLAKKTGLTAGHVLLLIEHWKKQVAECDKRWNDPAAVLYSRIIRDKPGLAVKAGWIPDDKTATKTAAIKKENRARQSADRQQERQRAADAKRLDNIERRYGAEWEAMPPNAKRETAKSLLDADQYNGISRIIDGTIAREMIFNAADLAGIESLAAQLQAVA